MSEKEGKFMMSTLGNLVPKGYRWELCENKFRKEDDEVADVDMNEVLSNEELTFALNVYIDMRERKFVIPLDVGGKITRKHIIDEVARQMTLPLNSGEIDDLKKRVEYIKEGNGDVEDIEDALSALSEGKTISLGDTFDIGTLLFDEIFYSEGTYYIDDKLE